MGRKHVGAEGHPFGAKNRSGISVLHGQYPPATANKMRNTSRQMFNLSAQLKYSVGHVYQTAICGWKTAAIAEGGALALVYAGDVANEH